MNVPTCLHDAAQTNGSKAEPLQDAPSVAPLPFSSNMAIIEWKAPPSLADLMDDITANVNANASTRRVVAQPEPKPTESNAFAFSRMFQSLMKPKLTQVHTCLFLRCS